MKQQILALALATVLLAACGGEKAKTENDSLPIVADSVDEAATTKEFKTFTVKDQLCFVVHDEELGPEYETYYVRERFSVVWPEEGMMTEKAMKELMSFYFNVEPTTDIKKGVAEWRDNVIHKVPGEMVKNIDEDKPYSYSEVNSTCSQSGNIATFFIGYGNYDIGAIHGLYGEQYLTVDVESGEIVNLDDLIDTSRLCRVVARAIHELDDNSDIQGCLFDEYINAKEMPMTMNFFIDSAHTSINVVYDLYHITPYCCGIQHVALPVKWLSKQVSFTPYGRRLLGMR